MYIKWFEISNFRSVLNSEKINIEEFMVLVGKNQAGKSSILQGLEFLSFTSTTNASTELTSINNIRSDYEDKKIASRKLPIVTANFDLEDEKLQQISQSFAERYSNEMQSENKFEQFIISLIKESQNEIQVEVENPEFANKKESDSETEEGSESKQELPPEKIIETVNELDIKKFEKLVNENFKNLTIRKFVDGEYSVEINKIQHYFENPYQTESKFKQLGRKIWEETNTDYDRGPNNQFKNESKNTIDELYYFEYKNLLSKQFIENFNQLPKKGIDDPLRNKLNTYVKPIADVFNKNKIEIFFHKFLSEIYGSMPNIFYFTNYERLEDSLTLTEINDNPAKHETFINFLKLADINIDTLKKHKDKVVRLRPYLSSRSGEVTKKIQDVYKQENINFNIEFQNDIIAIFTSSPLDPTNLLPPSAGSAGFQWYVGFYINFAVHTDSKYRNAILLLDDPGVLLHPSGHKDLLDELKGYTDKNITIIYSTHIPSLIPKDNFSSIRVVLKENMKTKIIENFWKLDKFDSWSPVRSVLGVDFTDSLFAGSKTLLVEVQIC